MPLHKTVRLYTDGGARGNPGPAASAAILKSFERGKEGETIATASKYLGNATNNQAEYFALIIGLEKAKTLGFEAVDILMDSELIIKQMKGEYRVKNPELSKMFLEVWNLRQGFSKVDFRHIPREKNSEADALVNKTIDERLAISH